MLRALTVLLLLGSAALAQDAPHTPPAGSVERRDIFDALRAKGDDGKRVFVARTLHVLGEWAWVVADPQSADGRQHFETESALVRQEGGRWRVVDQPCGEADCETAAEIARMRRKWPGAPAAIFR